SRLRPARVGVLPAPVTRYLDRGDHLADHIDADEGIEQSVLARVDRPQAGVEGEHVAGGHADPPRPAAAPAGPVPQPPEIPVEGDWVVGKWWREPELVRLAAAHAPEAVQGGEDLVIAPLEPRMKPRAGRFGDGDVDEPPVGIDRGVPSAELLVDADADEE